MAAVPPTTVKAACLVVGGVVQGLRLALGVVVVLLLAILAWAAARRAPAGAARGTFQDHVAELRRRLLVSLFAVAVGFLLAFSFHLGPEPWWLPRPALHDTIAAQIYQVLAAHAVPDGVRLVALRPLDSLSAELNVSLAFGVAVASPIVAGELAAFVGPALRPAERRIVARSVVPVVALFLLGAAFAVGWVAPALLAALYGYAPALGAEPMLAVNDLVGFVAMLGLLFGLAFQTPLVMVVATRAGLVEATTWRRMWRHATIAIVALCAFVTDGTIVTLALVAGPILGLYLLGVAGATWFSRGGGPTRV